MIRDSHAATVFVCANCARRGRVQSSAERARPELPCFDWPESIQQVAVPCTGRLQPEHVLKAFESGSSIVSIIGCEEDNCHHSEGSRRCIRRVEYLRGLLNEIGLGDERLLFFQLPGSASQDMSAVSGRPIPASSPEALDAFIAPIVEATLHALRTRPENPLKNSYPEASIR